MKLRRTGLRASWDAHWDLVGNHGLHCAETDKPLAGLIKDLKSHGLWDDTLIVWHGEFGRLPISERMDGRDMRLTDVHGKVIDEILA